MTIWKTDRFGTSAYTVSVLGTESRLIAYIPPTDTILPADPLTVLERRAIIQDQIDELERNALMSQAARQILMAAAVHVAAAAGVTEAQLYQTDAQYKLIKDLDSQITTLHTQMIAIV